MRYLIKIVDEATGYEKELTITEPVTITEAQLELWGFNLVEADLAIITMEPKGELAPVDFEDSDFDTQNPFTWPSIYLANLDFSGREN